MSNANQNSTGFEDILHQFLSRRGFIKTALSAGIVACSPKTPNADNSNHKPSTLGFSELAHGLDEHLGVAEGYSAQVLVRWGDPLFENAQKFDPHNQTQASQLSQFGYNNDFIGYLPLPLGGSASDKGLLVVNHEYTNADLMHPNAPKPRELTEAQTNVDIAAHGLSVIEISQSQQTWQINQSSLYTRRITPNTEMEFSGAARGNTRLKDMYSPDGIATLGTFGNCAGGVTPWGTILTGEENVDYYFTGNPKNTPEAENYARFSMRTNWRTWGKFNPRWDLEQNPQGALHVGWIVEIDPYDPNSAPKKRTSLGRCKHEGCNVFIDSENNVVAYTGDDQRFEYIYKFVSKNKYDPKNRNNNLDILDEGTLFVAKFHNTGELEWLPLLFNNGPLTLENGFASQGDVCIDVRKAADLVGATPMDRPEDIEVNPKNGRVYAMLTNNSKRKTEQVDGANPRAHNDHGQIIEFWPESGNHAETTFKWDLFLLAGDPTKTITKYHPDISENGWLSSPDNCAFDHHGNLWIATDGAEKANVADGLWATEVKGRNKALTKRFLRTPKGAELCGPYFTPDTTTLFVAIQHPASGSNYHNPKTRWPDFDEQLPPRPSVVAITKDDGGVIGS